MIIKKIITHNGQFHADEIFACALLQCLFGDQIPVERTRDISAEDIDDPTVWVLDVARMYDRDKKVFDHHQDESLFATNMIVLYYLHELGHVNDSLFNRLHDTFEGISNIDRGGYDGHNGFQVNSLIKSFNSLPEGFSAAISIARLYIKAKLIDCHTEQQSGQFYDEGQRLTVNVRVCENYPVFWKSYQDVSFLVAPDQNGKWCLHSIDSKRFPIHYTGKESFTHAGRMIGGYHSKDDAVEAAMEQEFQHFG